MQNEKKSGHIKHEDIDMDTHDRAVRRNAGSRSRSQDTRSSSAPLWLICILIFVGVLGFFLIRLSSKMKQADSAQVDLSTPAPQATEELVPETAPVSDPAAPADGSSLLIVEGAETPAVPEGTDSGSADILLTQETVPTPTPTPGVHVHSFVKGVCSVCGEKPAFLTDWLPDEFYQEAAHGGTVTAVEYDTKAFAAYDELTYHKRMNVYLPYGYDEHKPYNVLVLIHGQGDNEDDWLVETHESGGHAMCGRVILDNIFEQGLAEPCIVVTPVTETKFVQGLTAGIVQMQDELRETILPYIVEHYSTYAKDSSEAGLQAARSHFGLGGLSNGALFTYEGGMRKDFDLFGSYCAFSGNGEPWKTVSAIQEAEFAKLPVDCLFTGAGSLNDWQQNYTEIGFEYFVEKDARFVEGENAWRVDVDGGHEWKVWFTCLYNAMQVMFQSM